MGIHVIDFRDHRDFAAPLEFLLLDEHGFEAALEGKDRYWFGNPLRLGAWLKLWRNAGFNDIEHLVDAPIADEAYLHNFLPRLRCCSSFGAEQPRPEKRDRG